MSRFLCLMLASVVAAVGGAQARPVATIAEMVAATTLQDGARFEVGGYRQPGDDGGGVFVYEAESEAEVDGGTVLAPGNGEGRLRRVFDRHGDARAEWFGAQGDGEHADNEAINACLRALGRVKLLAKTYAVRGTPPHYDPDIAYHAIDLGPGYKIEGTGREQTVIRLLDGSDPKGSAPGNNYFNVLANRNFHESADHVIIRDLAVDCNFDGQNRHTTINAIGLRGGAALVERCNFRGYGTGKHPEGSSRECFAIHQSLVFKARSGSRRAATYRDLDFTDPGHNGDLEGNVGEITHITLGGANNFDNRSWILPEGHDPDWDPANGGENENNWWPSYGGLVENCVVHDEHFDPATQKSPLHAITYGDCAGLLIRNNTVTDFDGAAVFVMSWWNRDTTIVDNEFINVANGLSMHIKGHDDKPVQAPRHDHVLFAGNHITLGAPKNNVYTPIGVQLYGQALGEGTRIHDVIVRDNVIEGRKYDDAEGKARFPVGIVVQILHANYERLRFEDNVIDVPDYGSGGYIPQEPHAQAMTFFPLARWDGDAESGNVIYSNNQSPDGKVLRPLLQDWSYKNEPMYGTAKAEE